MAIPDATKQELKQAFARDPIRLVQALGLRIDDRASKPPTVYWVFDGNETKASLQIGGRPGCEGLCTRYGDGDEKPFDCFSLVQRYRPQTDFRAALAFVADCYGVQPEQKRVVRWNVVDADGAVLARHCRRYPTTEPKDRWWEPPTGGKGGLGGRNPKTLPLYRLPELLQQPPGTPVVIAEGEPATDAIVAAGLVAVGTYGTGANPTDEVLAPLLSYLCILWPDADASGKGEKHMQHVADRLLALGAETVLRAHWPDAPDKADAADTTAEHVREIVGAAVPWEKCEIAPEPEPEQTPAAIDVCTATSLLDRVADVEWLWPEWLPLGCVAVLAGEPGIGKSSVALSLAASQVTGTPWPDEADCNTRGPVLISDSEGAQALWAQRIRAWGVPTDDLLFAGQDGFGRILLDDERHVAGVRELVRERGVKLAIIDSLRTSLGAGVDENGSAVGAILAPWAELCRDVGLCLVLVHHFSKRRQGEGTEASMDRLRGSSAIAATARSIIALDKPDPEAATVRLSCVKSNLGELPRPLGLSISAGGLAWTVEAPRPPKAETATSRAIEFLRVQLAHTPQRYGDLEAAAAQVGISKNSLYDGRRALGIVPVPDPTDPSGKGRLWGLRAKEGRDSSGWQ